MMLLDKPQRSSAYEVSIRFKFNNFHMIVKDVRRQHVTNRLDGIRKFTAMFTSSFTLKSRFPNTGNFGTVIFAGDSCGSRLEIV